MDAVATPAAAPVPVVQVRPYLGPRNKSHHLIADVALLRLKAAGPHGQSHGGSYL